MRLVRWKSRYNTGDVEVDQDNKKFVECVNRLIAATDEREHCQEMEILLTHLSEQVSLNLAADKTAAQRMTQTFYANLIKQLPLRPYDTPACHKCGLCDLAKQRLADHLQAPLRCLSKSAEVLKSEAFTA